jgi:hypothetical protein
MPLNVNKRRPRSPSLRSTLYPPSCRNVVECTSASNKISRLTTSIAIDNLFSAFPNNEVDFCLHSFAEVCTGRVD